MKKLLPNKLSALMRVALVDLAKAERSKYVGIDMGDWVTLEYLIDEGAVIRNNDTVVDLMKRVNDSEQCTVCFAGSVMAYSLDVTGFDNLSTEESEKMQALNYVREGEVRMALLFLNLLGTGNADSFVARHGNSVPVTNYDVSPKHWRKDMWKIIRKLERLDL